MEINKSRIALRRSIFEKFYEISWGLITIVCILSAIGTLVLYSAAGGNWDPWAEKQLIRFSLAIFGIILIALVDIRFWLKLSYLIYIAALISLVSVEILGVFGMGARRWIDLGFVNLQPSEFMKIGLAFALARFYHGVTVHNKNTLSYYLIPILLIILPIILVLRQPDLGTAILLLIGGAALMFIAGVSWFFFISAMIVAISIAPVIWSFLRDYQQDRVLTFLNPEKDPLGAGYHIIQSKIALGSGGISGRGFLQGSQSQLDFIPEMHTDFVFSIIAEEFGLFGSGLVMILFMLVIILGIIISLKSKNHFGTLLSGGLTVVIFLYVFSNIAMVMGLMPVVGVPLPLISYGGTAMLTFLLAIGFISNVNVHRDVVMDRPGQEDI